eukprot:GHVU01026925.1.p1 GENE.GHVU01026925.1~~GHVU01026925.1.p1  ORF type:complete len:414 (+),score=13.78 GHVU01026925.1:590-1831(+)
MVTGRWLLGVVINHGYLATPFGPVTTWLPGGYWRPTFNGGKGIGNNLAGMWVSDSAKGWWQTPNIVFKLSFRVCFLSRMENAPSEVRFGIISRIAVLFRGLSIVMPAARTVILTRNAEKLIPQSLKPVRANWKVITTFAQIRISSRLSQLISMPQVPFRQMCTQEEVLALLLPLMWMLSLPVWDFFKLLNVIVALSGLIPSVANTCLLSLSGLDSMSQNHSKSTQTEWGHTGAGTLQIGRRQSLITEYTDKQFTPSEKSEFHRRALEFVADHNLGFNVFESGSTRRLFETVRRAAAPILPSARVLGGAALVNRATQQQNDILPRIKESVKEGSSLNVLVDGWKDGGGKEVLGVVVASDGHWFAYNQAIGESQGNVDNSEEFHGIAMAIQLEDIIVVSHASIRSFLVPSWKFDP